MAISGKEPGPPDGHLGTAWEIAVVSAFVVVIFAVIVVVIFQLRRKRRRQRELDLESATRSERRKSKKTGGEIEVDNLKKAQPTKVSDTPGSDVEIVSETETESRDNDIKSKRISGSSKYSSRTHPKSSRSSRPKKSRQKKASNTAAASSSPPSDDYYFEHPSQKPPKYYWER
ncbi:hypothetical protein CPC08DRAFT_707572 [Agrocybe pediades]|nr:hypothetical protein CPC08DRAFT_707572 [Agrocybe pediades]